MKKRNAFVLILMLILSFVLLTGCRYKNEYSITLKIDDVTEYKTIRVSEGTNFEDALKSNTPTREGYVFLNWQLDGEDLIISESIYKDLVLIAKWARSTRTIIVKPNYEGGETKTITVGTDDIYTVPSNPIREGYTFMGYYTLDDDGNHVACSLNGTYTGNGMKVYCEWKLNEYTVKFFDGTTELTSIAQIVQHGAKAVLPAADQKVGCTFDGWYEKNSDGTLKNQKFDFTSKINNNVELFAKYDSNQYVVAFKGCENVSSLNVSYDKEYTLPVPTKVGYTFAGWTLNSEPFVASVKYTYTSNITLVATWTLNTYCVNFDVNGEVISNLKQVVNYDANFEELTFDGYSVKYYKDANKTEELTNHKVTSDMTIYVKKTANKYTISFDDAELTDVEVTYGQTYNLSSLPSQTTSGTILSFSLDGQAFSKTGTYNLTKNIKLTPIYEGQVYVFFNGIEEPYSVKLGVGGKTSEPASSKTSKDGYTFVGWYLKKEDQSLESTAFDFLNTEINSNVILMAKYNANSYKITVKADEEDQVGTEINVTYNESYSIPSPQGRTGYNFLGFYQTGSTTAYNTNSIYKNTSDITVIGKWEKIEYTVKFVSEGLELELDQNVEYGDKVTKPQSTDEPTKTGYTFDKWYVGGQEYDFNSSLTSNLTLYANFKANSYTITINDDNNAQRVVTVTYDQSYSLGQPQKVSGKLFANYKYNSEVFAISGTYTIASNITVTVEWDDAEDETLDDGQSNTSTIVDGVIYVGTGIWYSIKNDIVDIDNTVLVEGEGEYDGMYKFIKLGAVSIKLKKGDIEYTSDLFVVDTINILQGSESYENVWKQNTYVSTNFLNTTKTNYKVGNLNFVPDLLIKNSNNVDLSFNANDYLVTLTDGTDEYDDFTINDNGSIDFDNSLISNSKTYTLKIKPKYNFKNVSTYEIGNIEINNGVNVYDNNGLFNAYKDLSVQKINVLRNINADVQFRMESGGVYDQAAIYEGGPGGQSVAGAYIRQLLEIDTTKGFSYDNLVIEGNYYNIDATQIRDGFDHLGSGLTGYEISNVHTCVFHYESIKSFGMKDGIYYGHYRFYQGSTDTGLEFWTAMNNEMYEVNNTFTINNLTIDGGKFSENEEETVGTKTRMVNSDHANGIYVQGGTAKLNNVSLTRLTMAVNLETYTYVNQDTYSSAVEMNYCQTKNNWSSSIISFGYNRMKITNSKLGQSNGAIIDVYDISDGHTNPTPKLSIDHSSLLNMNSFVSGEEPWFVAYNMTSMVTGLRDGLDGGMSQMGFTLIPGNNNAFNFMVLVHAGQIPSSTQTEWTAEGVDPSLEYDFLEDDYYQVNPFDVNQDETPDGTVTVFVGNYYGQGVQAEGMATSFTNRMMGGTVPSMYFMSGMLGLYQKPTE